jgi:hypothetical protein
VPPRPEHPLVVLAVEALARRFGVETADLWAWLDRRQPAPRWFVDAALAAFYPGLRESDFDIESLTSLHGRNTVEDMGQAVSSNALRSAAVMGQGARGHALVQELIKRGQTLGEARAAVNKRTGKRYAYSTVASWVKPKGDPAARAIPEVAAKAFEAEYGVSLSAWSRVIPRD